MSSMNPPWEAGWPGRAGRPHRHPRHPGPGFGAAEARMGPPEPPEPPEGPTDGRGRGGHFRRRMAGRIRPGFRPGRPAPRIPGTRRPSWPTHPAR